MTRFGRPGRHSARAAVAVAAMALVACAILPANGAAQEVAGVALGPHGEPLAHIVVALHRVGDMGAGANVASVTTDDEGRFRFEIATPDSALYFAAMRYADRMYIGPPAMGGEERVTDYILVADPAAEAGAVASALSGGAGGMGGLDAMGGVATRPPGGGSAARGTGGEERALLLVGLIGLTAAALFVVTAPRYRRRRTRESLVELATVENRLAENPPDEERRELARRRHQLRQRLAPPT